MSTLITALHVIVCLFLMLTVLLQSGKGGGMGGAFGGSNAGTVFGGSGASTFLRKLTAGAATIFMMTSMTLAYIASHNSADSLERFSASEQEAAAKKQAARDNALQDGVGSGSGSSAPNIMMPIDTGSGAVTVPVENGSASTPSTGSAAPPATGSAATPAEKPEAPAEKPAITPAATPAGAAPSMKPTPATQKRNDKTPTGATPTPTAPKEPITGTAAPTQKPQPATAPGEATPAAPSTP